MPMTNPASVLPMPVANWLKAPAMQVWESVPKSTSPGRVWPFWGSAKFGWGPWMIGITLAIFGVVMAVFQGALSGPAVKLWGEHKVAMLGLASSAIGLVGYGWAPSLTWVIVFFVVHGPEGFVHPMLTAIMYLPITVGEGKSRPPRRGGPIRS